MEKSSSCRSKGENQSTRSDSLGGKMTSEWAPMLALWKKRQEDLPNVGPYLFPFFPTPTSPPFFTTVAHLLIQNGCQRRQRKGYSPRGSVPLHLVSVIINSAPRQGGCIGPRPRKRRAMLQHRYGGRWLLLFDGLYSRDDIGKCRTTQSLCSFATTRCVVVPQCSVRSFRSSCSHTHIASSLFSSPQRVRRRGSPRQDL